MVPISTVMELSTSVTGMKINSMVMVLNLGQMVPIMTEAIVMVRSMERAY